jgi:allophanate hydrolase
MKTVITVIRAAQMMSVQDLGREGFTAQGLSPAGAMDRRALAEASVLLESRTHLPAIEMIGSGATFKSDHAVRFALTGAPCQTQIDGNAISWNASHLLLPGQLLTIGAMQSGSYGYLTFAGGIAVPAVLSSHSAHLSAEIGARLKQGDELLLNRDVSPDRAPLTLAVEDRFNGGLLRIMPGPQTDMFSQETLNRFAETTFCRSAASNRQGLRLDHEAGGFTPLRPAGLISDAITCGDVQMTGQGLPYLLMSECQTIGGYPRIGTVLAEDLPIAAQAPAGAQLRFKWVSVEDADQSYRAPADVMKALSSRLRRRIRDPQDIADLLSYQLISGVTRGDDLE